ncbi:GCN5 family N-acetyltransferase [Corynebacterium falsenii DSM 44353]|uniref:GNAT family N-acetyltransferase n=1 Tax=Corynebacterium falsenii TaxID=108486 RepID=UPI0003E92D40|nr:N-acetyltransferase [Corynebacterium falsenii]AHI02261.1 GCN5 family N-acetyltransferase [Corynebacterium falsenii DSM 44353]UBI05027.1 N-acetyltransferase [Corynebacterium falsenii]
MSAANENTQSTFHLDEDATEEVTHIRPARPSEYGTIHAIVMQAFADAPNASHREQFVVDELRAADALTFSFVSIKEGRPVGHVAVSPVTVEATDDKGKKQKLDGFYGIGPISVLPELQGQGYGAALMEHALNQLRAINARGAVVLGDPGYYKRFGFGPSKLAYAEAPSEYFQALSLDGDELPEATVTYHEAFKAESA